MGRVTDWILEHLPAVLRPGHTAALVEGYEREIDAAVRAGQSTSADDLTFDRRQLEQQVDERSEHNHQHDHGSQYLDTLEYDAETGNARELARHEARGSEYVPPAELDREVRRTESSPDPTSGRSTVESVVGHHDSTDSDATAFDTAFHRGGYDDVMALLDRHPDPADPFYKRLGITPDAVAHPAFRDRLGGEVDLIAAARAGYRDALLHGEDPSAAAAGLTHQARAEIDAEIAELERQVDAHVDALVAEWGAAEAAVDDALADGRGEQAMDTPRDYRADLARELIDRHGADRMREVVQRLEETPLHEVAQIREHAEMPDELRVAVDERIDRASTEAVRDFLRAPEHGVDQESGIVAVQGGDGDWLDYRDPEMETPITAVDDGEGGMLVYAESWGRDTDRELDAQSPRGIEKVVEGDMERPGDRDGRQDADQVQAMTAHLTAGDGGVEPGGGDRPSREEVDAFVARPDEWSGWQHADRVRAMSEALAEGPDTESGIQAVTDADGHWMAYRDPLVEPAITAVDDGQGSMLEYTGHQQEIDDTVLTAELADEVTQPSEEAMAAQDAIQAGAFTGAEMVAEPGGLEASGGIESGVSG